MTETAYDWGVRHGSCDEALEMRKQYKTQAAWWRDCPRGDWLLWQLARLPEEQRERLRPQINRAVEVIVTSAIVEHALDCGVPAVEEWAARWLSGEDRSEEWAAAAKAAQAAEAAEEAKAAKAAWAAEAAWAAAALWAAPEAAAWAAARGAAWGAARAEEQQHQASDIRAEIPDWPEGGG